MKIEEVIYGLEKIIKGVYRQEYSDCLEEAIKILQREKKFEKIWKDLNNRL